MKRTVILSDQMPAELPGTVLTLNRRAAIRLGVRPLRLSELALRTVQQAELEVASAALSQRLLSRSVKQTMDVREPGLTARVYLNAVRELLRSGTDLTALSQNSSSRVAQLARLTLTYEAALREAGVLDAAEVLGRASQLVTPQLLSLTGHPRLLTDEQAFLNAAGAPGSVIHLPWADHPYFQENLAVAEAFAESGWVVEKRSQTSTGLASAFLGAGSAQASLHIVTTEDQEVRTALGQVKHLLLSGTPASDIALVVSDDERWEGVVRATAKEYGIPLRLGTSAPAAETRLGRWILRALKTSEENFSLEALSRLLAHPFDMGLDGFGWQRLREVAAQRPSDWPAAGIPLGRLVWPEEATRRAWVAHLLALLEERGVADKAAHGTDLLALNFVRAELPVLATPPEERIDREQFFEELRDLLGLVTVPSQLSRTGVELLTPPSLIGASVPHIFFLGTADGSFPAPLQDDPALDFLERKRLQAAGVQIETAASLSRRNAVIFWAALQATGQATFSYARLSGTGLPSAYLAPLQPKPVEPPLYACSPEEARRCALRGQTSYLDGELPESRRRHAVETQRLQSPEYGEYDGQGLPAVDPSERVFSASQLTVLGRCGFRWWLEYGLRLRPEEEQSTALDLGRLRHEVLRRAALRVAQQPGDVRETMLEHLDTDWRASEEALSWPQSATWDRERPEQISRLRRAIEHQDFIGGAARPLDAEKSFEGEWFGLRVRGTVDRLDDLAGKVVIIDYKSGASKPPGVQDQEHQLKLDIQLPLYVQAALPQLYPGRNTAGAYYLSLRNGQILDRLKINMTEYEALTERLKTMLMQGNFAPRPDVNLKACTYCSWQAVCRAGPRLERKEFI